MLSKQGQPVIGFFSCCKSSFLFGEQAQGLAQGGDRGGQINPGASVLPFSFDGFEFDTQAGWQIAFAQTEGLLEEPPRLTRQLSAFLGGRQLRAAGFDAHSCCFQIGRQALLLVRREGRVYAYRNRCPHRGVALEWQPDRFLDDSGSLIQCARHGALFLIESGECVAGPCAGEFLVALPCREQDGAIWVEL